jgi:RecA/RadA recombinase
MGILNIRPVVRGQTKAIIGIAGATGEGKTYTALLIARGMVDKPSEIGFLDTENGRGSFYADILDGPFLIADLYPPFSPKRYSEAIKEFQDAGVKVIVIDSVTHEWEGEGGCEDIAHQKVGKMDNWIGAKSEHKRFMNNLLQSSTHIIACIRAREKTDFRDPAKPVSLGLQPITEKNFMFEMMVSIMVGDQGKTQKHLKMPLYLKNIFGDGKNYLGREVGEGIIKWLNTGEKEDPEITKCKSEMLMICETGLEPLLAAWEKLSPEMQKKMKPHMGVYKESAKAYDAQRAAANGEQEYTLEALEKLFEANKDKLSNADKINIQRTIANKEEASYKKYIDLIQGTKPVMP